MNFMNIEIFAKHESKTCPSCNSSFECKVGSILECECMNVQLTHLQRDYIRENFTDCLCVNCLRKISNRD